MWQFFSEFPSIGDFVVEVVLFDGSKVGVTAKDAIDKKHPGNSRFGGVWLCEAYRHEGKIYGSSDSGVIEPVAGTV